MWNFENASVKIPKWEKNCVKKQKSFFRMFLWTRRLDISLSWRKSFRRTLKSFCSRSEFEKNKLFWSTELQFWTSCQIASAIYLEKPLHKPEKDMIFWNWKFLTLKNCLRKRQFFSWKIRPETCRSQSEKSSEIKCFSKTTVFPQTVLLAHNVQFWQLCWNFVPHLRTKSLIIRKHQVNALFIKKYIPRNVPMDTKNAFLSNLPENFYNFHHKLEKFPLRNREVHKKITFLQRNCFQINAALDTYVQFWKTCP